MFFSERFWEFVSRMHVRRCGKHGHVIYIVGHVEYCTHCDLHKEQWEPGMMEAGMHA